MREYDLKREILPNLDPALLDYQQWLSVGMALKESGYSAQDWEDWSRRDPLRYHPGECARKWSGFHGTGITAGTVVQLAREQGWSPEYDGDAPLSWDDVIGARDDQVIVDRRWLEEKELPQPDDWHPARELTRYLEALFDASETVGYVTQAWYSEEKQCWLPQSGTYTRTAGELIEDIARHGDDLGAAIGDANPHVGAWIRFNPLDGRGVKNDNVTEYRWALVESDSLPLEQQFALIHELELPARIVVHSGGKSLHAIVHVDAANYEEYRQRVDYLYKICNKNGLIVDQVNRNPSRLSRMPGVMRNGKRQYIVAENMGRPDFETWREWIESVNDDLPEPENLADMWDHMPELAPPLIDGVLRQGHKLLIAGPSKAGKSFGLIELCIAISEGLPWMGFPCHRGRVMYVNLELDSASCWNRIRDVYEAMGLQFDRRNRNLTVWNLRGKAVPMDKLAPRLIRRAAKKDYMAIVIDPIYKVITGDENSADQMAKFCNQFDLVCTELGCAVIYCHHHSKGLQGKKRSMDRASGSGVFARDPDAMLDLIELDVPDALKKAEGDRAALIATERFLDAHASVTRWREYFSQDDLCSLTRVLAGIQADKLLSREDYNALLAEIARTRARADKRTAWRMEGTLREFPRFDPVDVWFDYPIHCPDIAGCLKDVDAESDDPPWKKGKKARLQQGAETRESQAEETVNAIENCNFGNPPTLKQLADYLSVSERTVRKRLDNCHGYMFDKNSKTIVKTATT